MVEYQLYDNAMWDGQVTLSCRFHDDMWRTQAWPFFSEERWMLNSVSPISYLLHHTLTCYTRACHIATTCQSSVKCSVAEQIYKGIAGRRHSICCHRFQTKNSQMLYPFPLLSDWDTSVNLEYHLLCYRCSFTIRQTLWRQDAQLSNSNVAVFSSSW